MSNPILGLRTCIYKVGDLSEAKKWYVRAFAAQPYFDESYYVGFNIGGYELGLLPEKEPVPAKADTVLTYWGVEDIHQKFADLLETGAIAHEEPHSVGGELMVATAKDPWGNIIGLIYNPYFKLPAESE